MWDLQHFMMLLRPDPALAQALVFDFQPRDPEDALAALAVLSRREIPGMMDDLNTPTVSVWHIVKYVRSLIRFYNWRPNTQGREFKEIRRHFQKRKRNEERS
ncbi:unnamed protein product [Miscanthus lutarioriparius]|uniref:Uncharacterized protein n=1 Tax=Miscanthus lutarioriparius TaxID=422564 RepID=A0A811Q1Q6_9POAL|nr:unnamed protein product [Miscanthus lutarioriparius]